MSKLFAVTLMGTLSMFFILGALGPVDITFGEVPLEIAADAASQPGFFGLLIHGTARQRHDFAKGHTTQYGQMSFAADTYLQTQKGWSDQRIHDTGNRYGFSDSWAVNHPDQRL